MAHARVSRCGLLTPTSAANLRPLPPTAQPTKLQPRKLVPCTSHDHPNRMPAPTAIRLFPLVNWLLGGNLCRPEALRPQMAPAALYGPLDDANPATPKNFQLRESDTSAEPAPRNPPPGSNDVPPSSTDPATEWPWNMDDGPQATRTKLLPLLRMLGCADDIPEPKKGTTNLGYSSPNNPLSRAIRRASDDTQPDGRKQQPKVISLAGLTTRYLLQIVWPRRHELQAEEYPYLRDRIALSKPCLLHLESRNADSDDLGRWAFVLLARSGPESLSRLNWLCVMRNYRVPPLVFNHTLRHLSGHTSQTVRKAAYLVNQYLVRNAEIVEELNRPELAVDSVTKRIMFLRLFRISNYFAPTELPLVADIYAKHCIDKPAVITKHDVTFVNHILHAISLIPRIRSPYFTSLRYIIDAQVRLLRKMFKADPVMQLEPKGFRGIVRTRLAAPRSSSERSLIAQQGFNWPPWKEDHDGYDLSHTRIDSETEVPRVSDAGLVLAEMQHAGYPLQTWEQSAMILSGIEIKGTPTVPRRTWFMAGSSSGSDSPLTLWQARIRATRTLNEAWHIFIQFLQLRFETQAEKAGAVNVFQDMFAKILQARKQAWEDKYQEPVERVAPVEPRTGFSRFLPGDELEYIPPPPKNDPTANYLRTANTTVRGPTDIKRGPNIEDRATTSIGDTTNLLPAPENPARGAYVPVPPPTVDQLLKTMSRKGLKPTLGLIKLLINSAQSHAEAVKYLEIWYSYPLGPNFSKLVDFEAVKWWTFRKPAQLEQLKTAEPIFHPDRIPGDGDKDFPYAMTELAISFIVALTSTTYAPRKLRKFRLHLDFARQLLFHRIPHAIVLAVSLRLTSTVAWQAIIRGLNVSHLPRGLFQAREARYPGDLLAPVGFWDGPAGRKMKMRDVNATVAKIWKYLEDGWRSRNRAMGSRSEAWKFNWNVDMGWRFPGEPALVYELTIAAERGWEYEQQLKTSSLTELHAPLPFRASDVVRIFETMVGVQGAQPPDDTNTDTGADTDKNTTYDKPDSEDDPFTLLIAAAPRPGTKSTLPPVVIPRTAHIHAYVRLLLKTAEDDYEPLVRLTRWIIYYAHFLETKNRRLPIIAMGALWDCYSGLLDGKLSLAERKIVQARAERLQAVKTLVQTELRDWGGWASKGEVAAYLGENWRDLRESEWDDKDKEKQEYEDIWGDEEEDTE
ncbi:hypothetical protein Dda_2636 [Drechslerella dactyloides]|uniref:Uncharacterized protein n=1 Tax=Drechslerella dactyloides TaxID=74499 RepID=A0AAD6J491_DREDA|nr:hypothetical protein Dda_2636 [Drechslerella dactyloides]